MALVVVAKMEMFKSKNYHHFDLQNLDDQMDLVFVRFEIALEEVLILQVQNKVFIIILQYL